MHIHNWYHSNVTGIHYVHKYRLQYTCAFPLLFISPCWFPFAPLSDPLYLLGNPPSCDRIRPPWSQVACKLTSPSQPFPQPLPPPNSQNPGYQAPYYDDLKNPASSVRNSTHHWKPSCPYFEGVIIMSEPCPSSYSSKWQQKASTMLV